MAGEMIMAAMPFICMEEEEDLFRLSFCDDPKQPRNYLLMEHAKVFSEKDIKTRMNSYYVEVGGQENSQYGGINEIGIEKHNIIMNFALGSNLFAIWQSLRFETDQAKILEAGAFLEQHFGISVSQK